MPILARFGVALFPLARTLGFLTLLGGAALLMFSAVSRAGETPETPGSYRLQPIGQVKRDDQRVRIVLDRRYEPGLLGLGDFSHVWVLWWFDRNDRPESRGILQVHPRRDSRNPLTGVFATRAPVRPNLLGLTLCRIVSIDGNLLEIDAIDAYDGTPVLDLKPYLPGMESVPEAGVPARF